MLKINTSLFESEIGKQIYQNAEKAVSDFGMEQMLRKGVIVGLSGGADSVMLLHFLLEYRKNNFDFNIIAVHVNHMIRGVDADRDEAFCADLTDVLNVPFVSVKRDVPSYAQSEKLGLEEAARKERYSFFDDLISSRNDICTVAIAHNATDNIETVIFNMMRGAGTKGMSGIAPVRDKIVRPLIYTSSRDIRSALDDAGIKYVTDYTNFDTTYSRNYVRHEIIPMLNRLTDNPEKSISRMASNLRSDDEFIETVADGVLNFRTNVPLAELKSLHISVFSRVIRKLVNNITDITPEFAHINKIYSLLDKDNFSLSLPGGISFVAEHGLCYVKKKDVVEDFFIKLVFGENNLDRYGCKVIISKEKTTDSSSNVYKFSIQRSIPFDIIKGGLYIRNKNDGDSYRVGGMTKKVKRMFSDLKIPPSYRSSIPILCDETGILWIPGLPVRDHESVKCDDRIYMEFVITDHQSAKRFHFANEWKTM